MPSEPLEWLWTDPQYVKRRIEPVPVSRPRPENAFILFRRKKGEERRQLRVAQNDGGSSGPVKKLRQAVLSKTISQLWKGLTAEERQYWEDVAKGKKQEHQAM